MDWCILAGTAANVDNVTPIEQGKWMMEYMENTSLLKKKLAVHI